MSMQLLILLVVSLPDFPMLHGIHPVCRFVSQCDHFFLAPNAVYETRGHRRNDTERRMNPAGL